MKVYRAKTLFIGYKIGAKTDDLFVGVPMGFGYTHAKHGSMTITLNKEDIVSESQPFRDKSGINGGKPYKLAYIKWPKGML